MGLRKSHKQGTNGDKKRQVCRQGFDLALSCSVKDEAEAAGVAPAPEIRDRPESLRTSRGDVDFIMQRPELGTIEYVGGRCNFNHVEAIEKIINTKTF
jgi:hypothetical protein